MIKCTAITDGKPCSNRATTIVNRVALCERHAEELKTFGKVYTTHDRGKKRDQNKHLR